MSLLIVEDDEELRESLVSILKMHQFDVLDAGSIPEAQNLLQAHPEIHLVVCDYYLSNGTGIDLLESMKLKLNQPVKFFIITGDVSLAPQGILEAGPLEFLPKPFSVDEFLQAIRKVVANE